MCGFCIVLLVVYLLVGKVLFVGVFEMFGVVIYFILCVLVVLVLVFLFKMFGLFGVFKGVVFGYYGRRVDLCVVVELVDVEGVYFGMGVWVLWDFKRFG